MAVKKTFGLATVGTLCAIDNEVTEVMIFQTEVMILRTPAVSLPKQLCLEVCCGECMPSPILGCALPTAADSL